MKITLKEKLQLIEDVVLDERSTAGEMRVAMYLINRTNSASGTARLKHATVAKATRQSTRNAQRCTDSLARRGYFAVNTGGGRQVSNTYRMLPKDQREELYPKETSP